MELEQNVQDDDDEEENQRRASNRKSFQESLPHSRETGTTRTEVKGQTKGWVGRCEAERSGSLQYKQLPPNHKANTKYCQIPR